MIKKEHDGIYVVVCDECGDSYETSTKNFNESVEQLKKAGWVIKHSNVWLHFCPICQ